MARGEKRKYPQGGRETVAVLLCPRQINHRPASDLKYWAMVQVSIRNMPSENAGWVPGILSCPVPFLCLSKRTSYHRPRHYFSKPPPTYHSTLSFEFIRHYIISQIKNQSIWKAKFDNSIDLLGEPLFSSSFFKIRETFFLCSTFLTGWLTERRSKEFCYVTDYKWSKRIAACFRLCPLMGLVKIINK
jgi:hypothetical protein